MENLLDRITINKDIVHGKPSIRNSRYTVEGILEYIAGGDTIEDVLQEFPDLEREDITACIQYALSSLKHKLTEIHA